MVQSRSHRSLWEILVVAMVGDSLIFPVPELTSQRETAWEGRCVGRGWLDPGRVGLDRRPEPCKAVSSPPQQPHLDRPAPCKSLSGSRVWVKTMLCISSTESKLTRHGCKASQSRMKVLSSWVVKPSAGTRTAGLSFLFALGRR